MPKSAQLISREPQATPDDLRALPENLEAQAVPAELMPGTYGEKRIEPLRLGDLIMLSQTREEENPELDNLQDSIARTGLINQLDVARMPESALAEYVEFVNRIWNADHHMSELPRARDGYYYLVIAGHSRNISMIKIETEKAELARLHGYDTDPMEARVHCKIQDAPTPEDIIIMQLEENIHHQVPRERQAMCLVETYLYGVENGAWEGPTDFVRKTNGRFSDKQLRSAMYFAELPSFARDQVFAGNLQYSTAVELARTYPEYINYCLFKYFDGKRLAELSDEQRIEMELTTLEWIGYEIARIQSSRLNTTAAQKRFKAMRENWREHMQSTPDNQPKLFMVDPAEEFRAARQKQKRQYKTLLQSFAHEPLERMAHAIRMHSQLVLEGATDNEFIEQQRQQFLKAIGSKAVKALL